MSVFFEAEEGIRDRRVTGVQTCALQISDVDYGTATAHTTYGTCGVKVWVFKGEVLAHDPMAQDKRAQEQQPSR